HPQLDVLRFFSGLYGDDTTLLVLQSHASVCQLLIYHVNSPPWISTNNTTVDGTKLLQRVTIQKEIIMFAPDWAAILDRIFLASFIVVFFWSIRVRSSCAMTHKKTFTI